RGQRNRSRHAGSRPLGNLDDLRSGLIQHPVIVGFEPDPDLFIQHSCPGRAVFRSESPPAIIQQSRRWCRRLPSFPLRGLQTVNPSPSLSAGSFSSPTPRSPRPSPSPPPPAIPPPPSHPWSESKTAAGNR